MTTKETLEAYVKDNNLTSTQVKALTHSQVVNILGPGYETNFTSAQASNFTRTIGNAVGWEEQKAIWEAIKGKLSPSEIAWVTNKQKNILETLLSMEAIK